MRPLDPKLMEILVCPISKKQLVQIGDELICIESQLAYPLLSSFTYIIGSYSEQPKKQISNAYNNLLYIKHD